MVTLVEGGSTVEKCCCGRRQGSLAKATIAALASAANFFESTELQLELKRPGIEAVLSLLHGQHLHAAHTSRIGLAGVIYTGD